MTDKSEWQKAFVQEIDGELSDDSKKRKFREIVKKLVDDGWVKEFAPKKYQITTH
jgi:predicted NAD/FAD-dependent oxidoreductase